MISEVKKEIKNKLLELYPTGYEIYDEDLPASMSKPSFLIQVTNHNFSRLPGNRFINDLSFDLCYYSNQTAIRTDCITIQEILLQSFETVGTYRPENMTAKITDNVLNFTFNIRYKEKIEEEFCAIQQQQTNTKL